MNLACDAAAPSRGREGRAALTWGPKGQGWVPPPHLQATRWLAPGVTSDGSGAKPSTSPPGQRYSAEGDPRTKGQGGRILREPPRGGGVGGGPGGPGVTARSECNDFSVGLWLNRVRAESEAEGSPARPCARVRAGPCPFPPR